MLNLLLDESMGAYGPSHEEIMASNVLAFLSSSGIKSARYPLQKSKEFSSSELDCASFLLQESKSTLNNSKSISESSSDSMKSFSNSMSRDFFMGFDPVNNNCSDLDDDGLHGDRMKPLSSLENNFEVHTRFSLPQSSERRGSNSPANSKVLAAARVGRRARCKAMYYNGNKENLIMTHMKEMQEICLKHKGVKRKSAGQEGNVRFLALKQKRSTLSSWQTITSVMPSVSNVAAAASTSICKEVQHFIKSPQRTILSTRQVAHPLLGAPNDAENRQEKKIVMQESAPSQTQIAALPCSTFACLQSSGLPLSDSREDSSSSHAEEQLLFAKGDNFMGVPCTKPPTYPKATQIMSTIHNLKCSSHLVVDANFSKETGVSELHDQASIIEVQRSSSKVMEIQCKYAKVEKGSEDLAGHERAYNIAAGINVGDARCSLSHSRESSAGTENCNPQMEMCKIKLSDLTQTPAGSSLLPNDNKTNSPCLSIDKVLKLTKPLCFVNAPIVSDSGAVVKLAQVKQETSSQDSAEMNLDSQIISLNCELLPRHLSTSTREHIKDSARKNPLVLHNASEMPSQLGIQKPKDHTRARGIGLYQQSKLNNVGLLPKLRRGRPPRKSNLCPCPEPKEHADKFARICAPSGVLGKLNPGIITRLRDKNQVHAVLEAVIRGAFISGMKEKLKLQVTKEAADADASKGVHSEWKDKSRERTVMKGRKATSDQEFDLKLGFADQNAKAAPYLRGENERQRHPPSRVVLDSLNGQTSSGTFGVRKQEHCLPEDHVVSDVILLKGGSLPTSETYSIETIMHSCEVSEVDQNKFCSGDQKVLGYNNLNTATAGNVASCWLELLRLDIKGRLSALKRSRRRVRSVIVSGQLDATKGHTNQVDEMEKWRAFFMHMENVLCSEGSRLVSRKQFL